MEFLKRDSCEKSLHDSKGLSREMPPDLSVGSYWLFDEVYSRDVGFELRVLFDSPLREFTIAADNILIEVSS